MIDRSAIQESILRQLLARPPLARAAQVFRYLLVRGPLREYLTRFYQKRSLRISIARPGPTMFHDLDVDKTLSEIEAQGYSIAFQLSPSQISVISSIREQIGYTTVRHVHELHECFDAIARDPRVVEIVRKYIGSEPIIYATSFYWTGPDPTVDIPVSELKLKRVIHFDATDFRDLNLFIYLSDVDEESSPHVVFEGTHKTKKISDHILKWPSEKKMLRRYGPNAEKTITGPAGTAFFEDTSAFHIQCESRSGRDTFKVCYTLQRRPELHRYRI